MGDETISSPICFSGIEAVLKPVSANLRAQMAYLPEVGLTVSGVR